MSARQLAVANESASIEASQQRAMAAAASKPRSALEAMASRLQISPANLKSTLMSTVFKECRNDSEFAALIVVSNEYNLNPLLKEIYAFPAKGGGIVPMVSVDGWIKMMNSHPEHDGIEFEYINDAKGNTVAIEAIIYRKDRTRPTKVIEYMDECKGNTIPWQKHSRRMLRHRSAIQCIRIAYGFSGLTADGDDADIIDAHAIEPVKSLPSRQTLAEELNDEIPAFDKATGEIIDNQPRNQATGMTEVSEDVARELDAREGRADTDMGEGFNGTEEPAQEDEPMWMAAVNKARAGIAAAKNVTYLKAVDTDWCNARVAVEQFDADLANQVDREINDRRKALSASKDA